MANDINPCYRCVHFNRYYIKGTKHFKQTKYGLCLMSKENVNIHGTCSDWRLKRIYKKNYVFIRDYLNDLLIQISEIRGIFEDELDQTDDV